MPSYSDNIGASYEQIAQRLGIATASRAPPCAPPAILKDKGNDGRAVIQVPAEFFAGRTDSAP